MSDFIDRLTLYEILDIAPAASEDTVRAAIRSKRIAFHPDQARDAADNDLRQRWSKRVGEAEHTLLDPLRRLAYDQKIRSADRPEHGETSSEPSQQQRPSADSSTEPPPKPPPRSKKRPRFDSGSRRIRARSGAFNRSLARRPVRVRQRVDPQESAGIALAGVIVSGWLSTTNLLFQTLVKLAWLPLFLFSSLLRAIFGSSELVVFLSAAPILLIGAALLGGASRWQAYVAGRIGLATRRRSANVAWFAFCVLPLWALVATWLLSRPSRTAL